MKGLVCLALGGLGLPTEAQTESRYAGRPFVRVARANATDATLGFVQGFGRSQVVGSEVVIPVLGPGWECVGLARGRGGPLSVLARVGAVGAGGTTLSRFHDGIAEGTPDAGSASFVFAAGSGDADALYLAEGGVLHPMLSGGTILPSSEGLVANRLGEPHWVDGKLAVIAWHQAAAGVTFRGVYRVTRGDLERVADTRTALPGVVGVPDTFSSQIGFDGTAIVFWASRGEFSSFQGIFRFPSVTGGVSALASTGDTIPGTGAFVGFRSPPVVEGGVAWFFAYDTARVGYLVREENGLATVVAKDGDTAPEGGVLGGLGDTGLEVSEGRVLFGARTGSGAGVYQVERGELRAVVPGGSIVAGVRPTAITVVDLAGDTLLLQLTGPGAQPSSLVANLARPEAPVILSVLEGSVVPAGAPIQLKVEAAGDPPLAYVWGGPSGRLTNVTGDTLVIPAASAIHTGYYWVQVTNAAGTATSPSVLVNVEAGPEIVAQPASATVEAGDALLLRVTAVGGLPLGYAWWKDGAPLDPATAGREAISRPSAGPSDAGLYWAVVTNAFGSVTSATARVTVSSAGPNPVYAGRRFQPLVSSGVEVPGGVSGGTFRVDGFSEGMARWWVDRLVFAGMGTGFESLGLFDAGEGGVTRRIPLGIPMPNGLGVLDGLRLISSSSDGDAPLFFGNSNGVPVGIFRWVGNEIQRVVDVSTVVPGAAGEAFRPFYSVAVGAGRDVAFLATTGMRSGAYVAGDGGLRRLLDTGMELPVLGTGATGLNSLGFDGDTAAVLVGNAGLTAQAVLRVGGDGLIVPVAMQGDRIPGTDTTIRTFGSVQVGGGAVRFFAFDSGMVRRVMEWRDGESGLVAGPGDVVANLGTVTSIESSTIHATGGRVYLGARIRTSTGSTSGLFSVSPNRVWEPVLLATKLDGRRVRLLDWVEVRGERVVVAVRFDDGGGAFYANTASLDAAMPRLEYVRVPGGGIRVTVPEGFGLEASAELSGGWESVPGSGPVEVGFSGRSRFFRLRTSRAP